MLLYWSLALSGSCEYEIVTDLGAAAVVGAAVGASVAAGAEVAAGASVGVAEPQAERTTLARTSTASKAYSLRFTVSPPTESFGLDTMNGETQ